MIERVLVVKKEMVLGKIRRRGEVRVTVINLSPKIKIKELDDDISWLNGGMEVRKPKD